MERGPLADGGAMAEQPSNAFVRFEEQPLEPQPRPQPQPWWYRHWFVRHGPKHDDAGWGVAAVVFVGAAMVLVSLVDLLVAPGRGLVGLDGLYLVRLALGLGLVFRKWMAWFFLDWLVLGTTAGSCVVLFSAIADFPGTATFLVEFANAVVSVALLMVLMHPRVARNFD